MKAIVGAALVAASMFPVASVSAVAAERRVGSWLIETEKDRFSGEGKVIAMRLADGYGLGVRCFSGEPSIVVVQVGLGQGRFSEGLPFDVQFRADERPIISGIGLGLNDKTIQIAPAGSIMKSMVGAKEYAFRIGYKGTVFDVVIPAGKGASKALEEVLKSCPLEGKEGDEPSEAGKK